MDHLTSEQITQFRARLVELRDDLDARLKASRSDVKPVGLDLPIGRLTRMDAMQQQSMARATRSQNERRREHVGAALAAIARGDFGLCARCEEEIEAARLVARPESALCLECQEQFDRR